MGKIQILTQEQQIILDQIKQNKYLNSQFYFTGGTALSAFYLDHRLSEDLDFFSQQKLEDQIIFNLIQEWSKKNSFTFESRLVEVVYIFNLTFKNRAKLKVDFGYYPYKLLSASEKKDGIKVDSLLDIAVNKLLTIQQRSNVKDFVDLYYLLDKFTVWDLIAGVEHKFHIELEPFLIAADFMKVNQFEFLPKMIKPLSLNKLKSFFVDKAKKLGRSVVY